MPTSPPSRCGDPSCGHLATNRGRCDAHQRKAWAGASQHTQLMDSTLKREWRHLVMFTEYGEPRPCAHCGDVAVIADHIVPIGEGGALYDVSNGQPLCQACDDVKTREDLKRMRETRARSK